MEDYNFLFDSLAGQEQKKESYRERALEVSNDLKEIGEVTDPAQIKDVYKASDYVFMKDPFKFQNLDMKLNSTDKADDLIVCVVEYNGKKIDFMINLSETNGLNKGDILHIDLDKEGKENQTTFSESFIEHVESKGKSVSDAFGVEKVISALGIKNYEDIVREVNRANGFQVDSKKVVDNINKERGILGDDAKEDLQDSMEKNGNDGRTEEEELNIEEVAAKTGMTVDAIKNFCDKNGIEKITGISFTQDTENLSKKLDFDLPENQGVTIVRAAGINGKSDSAFIIDQNGETIYSPGDTPEGESFLLDVVKEGANGNEIEDVTEAAKEANEIKIGTANGGVEIETSKIEGKNLSDNAKIELEQEIEQVMEKLHTEMEAIKNGPGTRLQKAEIAVTRCENAFDQGMSLQESYKTSLPGLTEKTTNMLHEANMELEKAKLLDPIEKAVDATIGAIADATGISAFREGNRDEGYAANDPMMKYENGR